MTLEELGYELTEKNDKHYFDGYLDLSNTEVTSLPDNLVVGGSVNLYNTKITTLPDNLVVGGNLSLHWSNITSIPDNLIVGGSLDLERTDITTLPNNLMVGGSIYLCNNIRITTLPNNLIIGGLLNIDRTNITSLPDDLIVGGDVYFDKTKITDKDVNKVNHSVSKVLFWKNKEYAGIVKGSLYRVLSNKGSIYGVSWVGGGNINYLIVNSNCSKFAINNNLKRAKEEYNLLNTKK